MKLINKFLLIYLCVSTIVLGIGGVISYYVIKNEIGKELKWEFLDRIDRVVYLLEKGKKFRKINRQENIAILTLDKYVENKVEVTDTLIWDNRLEREERNVKVSAYRTIQDTTYHISTYGNMIESNDIREAVIKILLWMLGLQVIGAVGIGYSISGSLFKPFRNTLKRIQNFQLNNKEYLKTEDTNIKEFQDLNLFVENMTKKAVSDYKNLKEFAENASHEIQTPLAIANGTLELLTETNLNKEQFEHVEQLEYTLKKLSKLSRSLALLTKIENHEFKNHDQVNFSELIREGIASFQEFTNLANLKVSTSLDDDVFVTIHPVLADILWTNLFQNSVRHNIENGEIKVILTKDKLVVSNTGKKLDTDTNLLFERFKKADQNSNSIGLGLAIIKRIVDQNDLEISYINDDPWHHIEINLKSVKDA